MNWMLNTYLLQINGCIILGDINAPSLFSAYTDDMRSTEIADLIDTSELI